MLSLLRKLVGRAGIPGGARAGRRDRWIEPSNPVTRAVLDPSAPIAPPEQSLYESVKARYPIPERARHAPPAASRSAAPAAGSAPELTAEQQAAPGQGQEKRSERGRAA